MNKILLIFTLFLASIQVSFSQKLMTLDESMTIAEENSPTMQRTKLSLTRSRENLNAQNAALKSKFALSLNPIGYSHGRSFNDLVSDWVTTETTESYGTFTVSQPILLTDATISLVNQFGYQSSSSDYSGSTTQGFNNNLSLSFNQPLFTYNRTKMTIKELELALENTQLAYAIQLLALERQVTQGFFSVYQQQQSLDISKEAFDNMQQSYDIIKNKVEAGILAREELFQAELNLATTRSDYEDQQVSLENAKDNFKLMIGMSLYDDFIVLPNVSVDPIDVDLTFAIEQGLANRMEIRQSEITIQTSEFDLTQTKALNEFYGNLAVTVGLFGDNDKFGNIYESPTDNEKVSLSLSIPLWDWGEKKSRVKASEASIQSNKISLEEEKNNIILEVRQVVRSLNNLKNQIDIAKQKVESAQLTYELNLEKYKNGDLTGLDLSQYQNQLSQSQLSYTNSLISYKLELLNLKIQTLYDFENNISVTPIKTVE